MKPVYQQVIDNKQGDCMRAAIASLLELPYGEVPHFILHKDWCEIYLKFLEERRYEETTILYNPNRGIFTHGKAHEDTVPEMHISRLRDYEGVNGAFYASVYSPKYYNTEVSEGRRTTHAVLIDKDFNVVHDPNPNNVNVTYPESDKLEYNGVLQVWVIQKKAESKAV